MRHPMIIATVVWTCLLAAVPGAGVDLTPLRSNPVLGSPLGTWTLEFWSKRDQYPALVQRRPPAELDLSGIALSVTDDAGLNFHTNGRANWEGTFDWAPMLVFSSASTASYALGGTLSIRNDGPESASPQVTWAVAKLGEGSFETIATGTGGAGDKVDFGALEHLRAIPLQADQQLAISVWRHAWHWNGGAKLMGLTLEKVGAQR